MIQKYQIIIGFTILIVSFFLIPIEVHGEPLERICIYENNARELDFRFLTGVREFDEQNKKVELSVDVYIKDEKTAMPINVTMIIYPFAGGNTIQEKREDGIHYEKSQSIMGHRITPTLNSPVNIWPFEKYHIPIFLEFKDNVKLCYNDDPKRPGTVSSYKGGIEFPNNPDWQVGMVATESTLKEVQVMMPSFHPSFTNSTIIKLDTIIFHNEGYQWKNGFYITVPAIPIILIIAHLLFVRSEKLEVQISLFTGVTILILTSLFAIKPSIPIDLTLIEVISLTSVALYAGIIFIILKLKKPKNNNKEQNFSLNKKPYSFHKSWKKFSIAMWIAVGILAISFVIGGRNDTGSITSRIADVTSVLSVFFSAYVAIWAYGIESDRKKREDLENEYYVINVHDNLIALGRNINFIFRPDKFKSLDASEIDTFQQEVTKTILTRERDVLAICSELRILNLNPHISADLKDIVYGIIATSKKIVSTTPESDTLKQYYVIIQDIMTRIESFVDYVSLPTIERLREKHGT